MCVYVYYIFFIHLPVDDHLGCFWILTVVNSATTNTEVHVQYLFQLEFSSFRIYAQEWDCGITGALFLVF